MRPSLTTCLFTAATTTGSRTFGAEEEVTGGALVVSVTLEGAGGTTVEEADGAEVSGAAPPSFPLAKRATAPTRTAAATPPMITARLGRPPSIVTFGGGRVSRGRSGASEGERLVTSDEVGLFELGFGSASELGTGVGAGASCTSTTARRRSRTVGS